jgi:gas vesicle protein
MDAPVQEHRDYGFMTGLLTGTLIGAGLALWFAPRSGSELRHRISDSAKTLGQRASDQYQKASARAGEALDEITRKGQGVRDDVAEAVARGAHEVERFATSAKTDRVAETRTDSAADRRPSTSRSL